MAGKPSFELSLKSGRKNKIEQHNLVEQAMTLLRVTPRLSYQEVADELNSIGNLEGEDKISAQNVSNLVNGYPEIRREVMLANRQYMRKIVFEGAEFDMLGSLKDMAGRLAFMIDAMEEMALEKGTLPDPKGYKALSSEFRETLKQIESIHKEVYDMEIVRQFLLEVIKTLREVSPEALQAFIEKMKGKRENSSLVSELLKGGLK